MLRACAVVVGLGILLCACGGGGGGTTMLPHSGAAAAPAQTATTAPGPTASSSAAASAPLSMKIFVPSATAAAAANRRFPRYISSATQSATIAVNGGTPVAVNLTSSSPNCSAVSGGLSCSLSTMAPVGTDTIAVALFSQTNAGGSVLSQATTSVTIVAGVSNLVTMTLEGVVASIVLALGNTSPPVGTAATIPLTVTLFDASGEMIIADPFANPVTLTDSDSSGATKLSATTLNSPADAASLTVAYTGASIASATFGATASGLGAANVTTTTLTPSTASPSPSPVAFNDWPTYGYDNARDGYNPNTAKFTDASVSALHLAWQANVNDFNTQSQPIVATEIPGHKALLFTGGGSGNVYGYDGLSGAQVWKTHLQQATFNCNNNGALGGSGGFLSGIGGSAVYDPSTQSIYIVDAANTESNGPTQDLLYQLGAANGAVLNSVNVAPNPLPGEVNFTHTSVTLSGGLLYAGTGTTCDIPYWRGRVVAVNEGSMTLAGTFFTTPTSPGGIITDGGGVWGWGGVSADASGNIYFSSGNADTSASPASPSPQFTQAPNEFVGFAEHEVQLSSNLSTVESSNYPGFTFQGNSNDLDFTGTPVLYRPSVGCDLQSAGQGKSGQLIVYDTTHIGSGPIGDFQLSQSNFNAAYMGNPAFSPLTGLLYATVASATGTLDPPGLVAISGCGSPKISWNAVFGPDSFAYTNTTPPRSAPTVTAGGVIFVGTPCTPDTSNGTCGAAVEPANGALWALDATTGTILNGGKPLLFTGDVIRMAPVVDGNWLWVIDNSGNFYGLTIDPSVPKIAARRAFRSALSRYHGNTSK